MKNLLLVFLLAFFAVSCEPNIKRDSTIEVTFNNGDKDTVFVSNMIRSELNKGDLWCYAFYDGKTYLENKVVSSGVRNYRVISEVIK